VVSGHEAEKERGASQKGVIIAKTGLPDRVGLNEGMVFLGEQGKSGRRVGHSGLESLRDVLIEPGKIDSE